MTRNRIGAAPPLVTTLVLHRGLLPLSCRAEGRLVRTPPRLAQTWPHRHPTSTASSRRRPHSASSHRRSPWPRTTPPELQWGEKERERKRREKGRKSRKREEKKERRKEKERERKKKINYLFIENIISKLYCLLFLGKENKNDNYIN
jgi:hypothetical protein